MKKFIEKLYFGRLDPQSRVIEENETVLDKWEVIEANERYLLEHLEGEQKEHFDAYAKAYKFVCSDMERDRFCAGFRYGTMLMIDVLID